jgi:hypothetical protein
MPASSDNGRSHSSAKNGASGPAWRTAFDVVERPVSEASQSWLNSDTFMDAAAVTWRVQRRLHAELRRGLDVWFGAWHLPTRSDVSRLSNQIAGLERQVRELRGELEHTESPSLGLGQAQRRRPASRSPR